MEKNNTKCRCWDGLLTIKIQRIMKLTSLLLFVSLLHISAKSFSQEERASLDVRNCPLEKVFSEIEKQTNYRFLYNLESVKNEYADIKSNNLLVEQILDKLFANRSITYKILEDELIVITPATTLQNVRVSGTITDSSTGEPVAGVNILVEGTTIGVTSDIDGKYSLEVPVQNTTLVFSFIGYAAEKVAFAGQSQIDIKLVAEVKSLDEIVVVGYGKQSKRNVTGSVTKVSMDKNDVLPNTNVLQSLRGSVAGVVFIDNGRPEQGGSIVIRGNRSITAGNNPLFIVDGTPFNGTLSDLNPNDIESMEVLKDPSSCAIYGARAANGVVIITSKMGKSEKPVFNLNAYYGVQDYSYKPKLLGPDRWIQKILDYRAQSGLEADPAKIELYLSPDEVENYKAGKTIDPWEVVKQFAPVSSADLSISSRTSKSSYYLSSALSSQKGLIYGDKANKLSFRANFDTKITSWLTAGFNSMFSIRDLTGVTAAQGFTYRLSPYGTIYTDDAEKKPRRFPQSDGLVINPMWDPLYNSDDEKGQNLFANFYTEINFPFLKGLKYRMNYSPNYRWGHSFFYAPALDEQGIKQSGFASKDQSETIDWTQENILSYLGSLGESHEFDITLMYGRNHADSQSTSASAQSFINNGPQWNSLGLGGIPSVGSGQSTTDGISSMARLNYRFKSRYLLTLTARRDGYSGFGENKKFGNFPSAAVAWIASDESFLKGNAILNFLKFKVSYGKVGNQAIGPYQTLSFLSTVPYVFGDGAPSTPGIYPSNMANSALSWETTTGTNASVEFELLQSKISGTVEYYNTNTTDLLLRRALPSMNGFSNVLANIGATKNTGVEVTLNTVNLRTNGFEWNSSFNFSVNNNKIVHIYKIDLNEDGVEDNDIGNSWFIGKPINVFYDYVFDGIYQEGDVLPAGFQPGFVRVKDLDGDGAITPDKDRKVIGNRDPKYRWALTNNFSYKGISLRVLLNSMSGWITSSSEFVPGLAYASNFLDEGDGWWTATNKSNSKPSLVATNPYGQGFYKSRDFVRIQEVALAYEFNSSLLQKLKINKLKLYVSGKNLYTFTKYPGFDPENGQTLSGYPMPRSIVAGMNINF